MKSVVLLAVVALGAHCADAFNYAADSREVQLISILDGARQLASLMKESFDTGSQMARSLKPVLTTDNIARALQESDPVEVSLKYVKLDSGVCRKRLVCEVQSKFDSYQFGDLAYEVLKRKVPKMKKYGMVTARSLGVNSCYQAFPCAAADSPLMVNARQVRVLVEDFCDLSGASMTSSICRLIKNSVDLLETL